MPRFGPALLAIVLLAPQALADPDPSRFWYAEVIPSLDAPTDAVVLVALPGYVPEDDPLGGPGLAARAIVEAVGYWSWALDGAAAAHPQLGLVSLTPRVLGVDATPEDVARARIVVTVAQAEPSPLGASMGQAVTGTSTDERGQRLCPVVLGILGDFGAVDGMMVRNLALHELGHCLGLGHTGSGGATICNGNGTCYGSHPTDVMSVLDVDARQCISNLNVEALAESYAWLTAPGATWADNDGETYLAKADYAQTCMPAGMERF